MAIDIKPENKGKYTARAESKGKSVAQQAKSDATGKHGETQRKRAQFAINMRKIARKHKRSRRR
jgi:hypothetical protein